MRIKKQGRRYFMGTHKGASIEIMHDKDVGRFYIQVRWLDGGMLYDGYAPSNIVTMRSAKREAVRGACLDVKAT